MDSIILLVCICSTCILITLLDYTWTYTINMTGLRSHITEALSLIICFVLYSTQQTFVSIMPYNICDNIFLIIITFLTPFLLIIALARLDIADDMRPWVVFDMAFSYMTIMIFIFS